jgi:hypothetical protein
VPGTLDAQLHQHPTLLRGCRQALQGCQSRAALVLLVTAAATTAATLGPNPVQAAGPKVELATPAPPPPTATAVPTATPCLPIWGQRAPAFRHGGEWPLHLADIEHLCYTACMRTGDEPVFGGLRPSAPAQPIECSARCWEQAVPA